MEDRRVLDGSVNLYTREKIKNVYDVGFIYRGAGSRLRQATRLDELSETAVLKLVEESGGELASFILMVWEGTKHMAAVSSNAVTIRRGVRVKKNILQACKDHIGKPSVLPAIQSFSLDPAVADSFPADGTKPARGEVDLILGFECIDCPLIQGLSQTTFVKEREVLTHPCSCVLVQAVAEARGKKPIVRLLDIALMPTQSTTAQTPARFKIFCLIKGEKVKYAREVARGDTIEQVVSAMARSLKRPDLAGLSGADGVQFGDDGTVGVLLEENGTYTVGSKKGSSKAPVKAAPEAAVKQIYQQGLALFRTPKEPRRAAELLKGAADLGHANAMAAYGECLENGRGVKPGDAEAYYRRGSEAGSAWALAGLAFIRLWAHDAGPDDQAEGARMAQEAADRGSPRGIYVLGLCFESGYGVPEDEVRATEFFTKAAILGYPRAMSKLGEDAPFRGDDSEETSATAAAWFEKAANLGEASAFWLLGECYQEGRGRPKDLTEAMRLFKIGRDLGDHTATRVCEDFGI
jgi:TPR repeat protein